METDASGIGLTASLLQRHEGINCRHNEVLDNMALYQLLLSAKVCAAQSVGTETSKEKYWLYFMGLRSPTTTALQEKHVITDHKLLVVAMINKDVATLSQ